MFEHSVKVPKNFKVAANIFKKVSTEGGSVKTLLYDSKLRHFNTNLLYALLTKTIQHAADIDKIFENCSLFKNEPRFDPWLAKVLTAELLYGKKTLPGKSKPEQTILSYKEQFEKYTTDEQDNKSQANTRRPRYVRINTNLLTTSDAIRAFQDEGYRFIRCTSGSYDDYLKQIESLTAYDFTQDYHVKTVFVFAAGTKLHEHELYLENKIILQDKATAMAVHLLAPPPGSVVLDMCAAPGMKTSQVAAYLRNEILCCLSFLATGSYQNIVGKSLFNYVSQPSASRAIRTVVNALNHPNIIKKYIRFPQNITEREALKQSFFDKFKIPGVIGCVDGTLVAMIRPKVQEDRYYCRKGYHARNVLIGKVYAVERNETRYQTLCDFAEKTGSKCVETLHKDALELKRGDYDDVEYILLDPSCSGSGMALSVHNYIEDTRLAKLTSLQEKFLKHAMNAFPNAKRIVYSTCSLFPEENERVITNVVKTSRAKWRVQDVKELLKGQWNNFGSGMYGSMGARCLYAKPDSDLTTGFFLAVLDRDSKDLEKSRNRSSGSKNLKTEDNQSQDDNETSGIEFSEGSKKSKPSDDDENQGTNREVEASKKKKKKKDKQEKKVDIVDEVTEDISQEDNSQREISKKKKKKKEIFETNDENNTSIFTNGNVSVETSSSHRKKKKKDKFKENDSESASQEAVFETIDEGVPEKHKPKKDKSIPISMEYNVEESEKNEKILKKAKKRHKNKASETECQEESLVEQGETVKKKKKKHKERIAIE